MKIASLPADPRRPAVDLVSHYRDDMVARVMAKYRFPIDEAEDVVHTFILERMLQTDLTERVERAGSGARAMLMVCLDHFTVDQLRSARAACRGRRRTVSIHHLAPATCLGSHSGDAFEATWARRLLERAIEDMRAHCRRRNREDVWDVFCSRTLAATVAQSTPVPYQELAARYGWRSASQGPNLTVTAIRTFARLLRASLASDVAAPTRGASTTEAHDERLRELWRAVTPPGHATWANPP